MLSEMALCASAQVSAAAEPTRLMPVSGYMSSDASRCTFNHCLQFSAVARSLHAGMQTRIHAHIPPPSLELRVLGTVPERQEAGKEKTQSDFKQNRLFMTHSSQTASREQGQPALPWRWPALNGISANSSEQTAQGGPREVGSVTGKVEEASHRGNAAMRLKPAGSRGSSMCGARSPGTHLD